MKEDTQDDHLQTTLTRYMPYLIEIRKRLLFIFAIFFIAWTIGFLLYQKIILVILNLYDLNKVNITFTSPFQFVNLAIQCGMLIGFSLTLPLIIHQILTFLRPAMHKGEYRLLGRLLPLSILLFVLGFSFGSWIMKIIVALYAKQTTELQIQNLWDINSFLSQILFTSLLLGIIFQFPLIITILVRFGVVKQHVIANQRKIAYLILLIVVIMLPPTDLFSNVLIFLPLAIIYELTILFNKRVKIQSWTHLKTDIKAN